MQQTDANYRYQDAKENCGMCELPATAECRRCKRPTCDDDHDKATKFCEDCFIEWTEIAGEPPEKPLSAVVPTFFAGMAIAALVAPVSVGVSLLLAVVGGASLMGTAGVAVTQRIENRNAATRMQQFIATSKRKLIESGD